MYLLKRLKLGKPVKALKLWCSGLLDHLGARESKDLALHLANLSNLTNLTNLSSSKLGAGGCACKLVQSFSSPRLLVKDSEGFACESGRGLLGRPCRLSGELQRESGVGELGSPRRVVHSPQWTLLQGKRT